MTSGCPTPPPAPPPAPPASPPPWSPAAPPAPSWLVAPLAAGVEGPDAVAELAWVVLDALRDGTLRRPGALPAGGPAAVRTMVGDRPVLPEHGVGACRALAELRALAAGSADPAHPWCAGHLHGPPLAVAAAADLAASVLNPSLDSWDQAPAASALEARVTAALAALVYPAAARPDALITSGGTETNLVALLLAREHSDPAGAKPRRGVTPVCGVNAHHSVARAAWLLGMPEPVAVPCSRGRMRPAELDRALAGLDAPAVVVATAGSTGAGTIDPLDDIATVAARHGARLHVDAAYGGAALLSPRLRPLLAGIERADTVGLDLHKLGWQPISAGVLAVADAGVLAPLAASADYLNAADDTEAGLPDLLGRSLRTSRRPDVIKIAVTFRALGRAELAAMVERCCANAVSLAERIDADPRLQLWEPPTLSTVLLRPRRACDEQVAAIRRRLLDSGQAVVGRATAPDAGGTDRLWLKLALLHPHATASDYDGLLELIAAEAPLGEPNSRLAHLGVSR